MDFLWQKPPKPLQIWPELPPLPANFVRPIQWRDKHFGQWCRNLTIGVHTQCPQASPFHWYVCCGEHGTDCCFGLQTWTIIMFGSLLAVFLAVLIFAVWLSCTAPEKPRLKPEETVEEPLERNSPETAITKLEPPMP